MCTVTATDTGNCQKNGVFSNLGLPGGPQGQLTENQTFQALRRWMNWSILESYRSRSIPDFEAADPVGDLRHNSQPLSTLLFQRWQTRSIGE
jgi:hypothetical protein